MATPVPEASSVVAESVAVGVIFPGLPATVDGSAAVVWVESHISQGAAAYPITPSTPLGDGFAAEFANGTKNLWGDRLEFLETESEHSSASACEGFALAGGRVANFTSGQGLILMKEELYAIAGKRLPVVFHIGARALTSQALNIHCGHDDVMGVADAGWGILFARNAQEAADLALIARRAAEESETPFLNVQDGFLTTHTLESLRLPEPDLMREFIGEPSQRLRRLFDPARPLMSGPVQNQESYMKGKVAQRYFYGRVEPALRGAMREYARLTGRSYGLVRPYRMDDADYAFVGLGSMMETAEAVVDHLRRRGMRFGAIAVTSFRPFPSRQLAGWLAKCRGVLVIDRADVPLAQSNPLTTELKAALADRMTSGAQGRTGTAPQVFSAVAGLGGSDVRPGHFVAAAKRMTRPDGRRFFVLGVRHPDALEQAPDPDVRPASAFSLRGHSVGGYGSVTTNKVLATVASDLFGLQVQAFSKYGSEKKGLPTTYYLTLASERNRVHAELAAVDFVAIQDANAFRSGEPLEGLREGGSVYFQSTLAGEEAWASLPPRAQRAIRERRLRLFVLDGQRIARETASRPDLEVRMQGIALLGAFLRLTPFREQAGLSEGDLFAALEKTLRKYFGKRGDRVVADNLKAARRGWDEVAEFIPPAGGIPAAVPALPIAAPAGPGSGDGLVPVDFCERVIGCYGRGRVADLEADEFAARGLMPPGTAAHRSFRYLSAEIPEFTAASCVGCMDCVNECPDTAILAKVATPEAIDEALGPIENPAEREALRGRFAVTTKYHEIFAKRGEPGGLFGLFIDPDKCKGCGECVLVCGAHNALRMAPKSESQLEAYDRAMSLFRRLPDTPARFLNQKSLGDMMLAGRSLLYTGGAGSCMGCGEGSAIRMLLAGTGFVYGADGLGIVAATGCNTVFGSTYPYNPFAVPWTNSLFENAPADAMGIRLRWDQEGYRDRRLWVVGGDGALFDIGFQSLSRMLMSGMNIKVLVLDTQVYSNTGGQSSTATFTGQNAKMAQFGLAETGKREHRKELAPIVMMHPGVFVAQTTPAHINHFYKSILTANEFPGPAVVICYASCLPEHGIGDDQAVAQARLAVESHAFPLLIYDPRRGDRIRDRLSLQGNPAIREDWYTNPKTAQPVDFVAFARTEGRFARHFDAAGHPDESLLRAQQDRLANWRLLRELAGF
jgi:pyruvate-ferredoxin/flavodoxin oxidoreductase